MKGFVDVLIAQLLTVQINLYACRERLQAQTDPEALHDLRIAVRKLRSLLRPLRGLADFNRLERAARELGQLSGPLRDSEVLLGQLQKCAVQSTQHLRQLQLKAGYSQLLRSPELRELFAALDACVPACRQAHTLGALQGVGKRTAKRLAKSLKILLLALPDRSVDRHRLRILVKRLRYGVQVYAQLKLLTNRQMSALSAAQSALGDWHDHQQWLAYAEQQSDLLPLVSHWQTSLLVAEQTSEQALRQLQAVLQPAR
jgi:CHAD domain-containing protein